MDRDEHLLMGVKEAIWYANLSFTSLEINSKQIHSMNLYRCYDLKFLMSMCYRTSKKLTDPS